MARVTLPEARRIAFEHYREERLPEAESVYRDILRTDPEDAVALNMLATISLRADRSAEALELIQRAIQLHPTDPYCRNTHGWVRRALGQPAEAEASFRRALELKPQYPEAHADLGELLKSETRLDEAEQSYRLARLLAPENPKIAFGFSLLLLRRGDYVSGFKLYESRFEAAESKAMGSARGMLKTLERIPRWQGENLEGRRLLLWNEQGLGDSVMMMRYLPTVRARGAGTLIMHCAAPLVRLMATLDCVDTVISRDAPPPFGLFDCHCPLMSLPLLLDTRLRFVQQGVPYLRVPEEAKARWRSRLASIQGLRVGLAWAAGRLSTPGATRDVPLEQLSPLLGVPGITFVCLQKGDEARQLTGKERMVDFIDECEDLLDTAALIEQLDLVISVDTVIPHLAGALGKPVWMLNRRDGDWRWHVGEGSGGWYPGLKIFTQSLGSKWDDPIALITAELGKFVATQS